MNPNLPDPGEWPSAPTPAAYAEQKRRARVIETARAAWVATFTNNEVIARADDAQIVAWAEQFEQFAAEYLKGGAK